MNNYEQEYDPSMSRADQIIEQHFEEYEPERRIDLDEGVIHTNTTDYDGPTWEETPSN